MKTAKRKAASIEVDELEMRREVNALNRQRREFEKFCRSAGRHRHGAWWKRLTSLMKAEKRFGNLVPADFEAFAHKVAYILSPHWDCHSDGNLAGDAQRLLIKQARRSGHRLHAVA